MSTQNQVALSDQTILVAELVEDEFVPNFNIQAIRISKTNRKRFNEATLNELGENIKANGLIQPILIRPVDPTADEPEIYEIVCGERRYRASKIAGLSTINVLIRQLSDTQAQELQLIENLQRENPHPMEEAEGYQQLMLKSGYTADMLAEKLKKSRTHIYDTLKLNNLCTSLREDFFENKDFNRSLALLIARIPVPEVQKRAYDEIMDGYEEPMSYRDAQEYLRLHYSLDLNKAIFKIEDAKLLPDAGSCKTCPKRAGNDPVYADIDANTCTDPDCNAEKVAAHIAKRRTYAEKLNIQVLEGTKATTAITQRAHATSLLVGSDIYLYHFGRFKPSTKQNQSVLAALGEKNLPLPDAIALTENNAVDLYNKRAIQEALEIAELCYTKEEADALKQASQGENTEPNAEKESNDENNNENDGNDDDDLDHDYITDQKKKIVVTPEKIAEEEARRTAIYKKIREKQTLSIESLRVFIQGFNQMLTLKIPKHLHEEFYGRRLNTDAEIDDYISTASVEQLQKLSLDFVFGNNISEPPHISMCDRYLNREDSIELLVKKLTEAEGITLNAKGELEEPPAEEPKTEAPAQEQPAKRGRGRPPKAKPEETKPWPFPEPASS